MVIFNSYVSHYQRVNHNKSIFPQCSCNYWSFSIATLNYQRVVYLLCVPKSLERPGMARLFFGPGQVLSLSPKHQRLMTGTESGASRLQTGLDMGMDQYLLIPFLVG